MSKEVKSELKVPTSSLVSIIAGAIMNESQPGFVTMEKVKEKLADMEITGKDLAIANLETAVLEEVYNTENMCYIGGNNLVCSPILQVVYQYDEITETIKPSLLQTGKFSLSYSNDITLLRPGKENMCLGSHAELENIEGVDKGLARAINNTFSDSTVNDKDKLCLCITLAATDIGLIADIVNGLPVDMKISNFKWDGEDGDDHEDGDSVCDIYVRPSGIADTDDFVRLLKVMRKQFDNIAVTTW